jgi:hypothetical protein
MNCYLINIFILHDNFKLVDGYENELKKYDNNQLNIIKQSSNDPKKEFDKDMYEADFVIFIISKENIFPHELILANTLGKECIYIFLDNQVYEMVKKTLDSFKNLLEKSFKFELFNQSYDYYLVKSIFDIFDKKISKLEEELMILSSSSSSDNSDDYNKSDEMPFRHGSYQLSKCTHGVRCYCSNVRRYFWR